MCALPFSLLTRGKEKCGRLGGAVRFEFMAQNCIYISVFIYKRGTDREYLNFASFRSVPFEKKGIVKKKGIVTFSFRSFESFLNAWFGRTPFEANELTPLKQMNPPLKQDQKKKKNVLSSEKNFLF